MPPAAAEVLPAEQAAAAAGDEKIIVTAPKLDARTGTSSVSADSDEHDGASSKQDGQTEKPKWYRRLNPIRLQKAPPVPAERGVSPEYGTNFFSLLSFQWMAPLMHVSFDFLCLYRLCLSNMNLQRRVICDHCNIRISGQ